jgi:glucuronate isomerase
LELKRPFGISDKRLSPDTAKAIWDECNAKLQMPEFSARGIMRQMNVKLVCTTDDPADSLEWHRKIASEPRTVVSGVLPTFRPDKAVQFTADGYNEYLDKLGNAAGVVIKTFDDLLEALKRRHDYFHENGCRLSDHGFFWFFHEPFSREVNNKDVRNIKLGDDYSELECSVLFHVAQWDAEKNWTMQLHIGAIRNNNSRMFAKLGPDSGFDSIADHAGYAHHLGLFFNSLDVREVLPKTIAYNLNPNDNEMLATMIGNFQGDYKEPEAKYHISEPEVKRSGTSGFPAKMQFGSGWWFLDQKDGMERQLNCLSNLGLLSQFVGMLTDSRSFLSYTRHEYFRRILCNLLGQEMHDGLLPNDFDLIGSMVKDICYNNAKNYFGFTLS